jgi:ASC-1-like (ASCH) protein
MCNEGRHQISVAGHPEADIQLGMPSWKSIYYGYPRIYDAQYWDFFNDFVECDFFSDSIDNKQRIESLNERGILNAKRGLQSTNDFSRSIGYDGKNILTEEQVSAVRISIALYASRKMRDLLENEVKNVKDEDVVEIKIGDGCIDGKNIISALKGKKIISNVNRLFDWIVKVWRNPKIEPLVPSTVNNLCEKIRNIYKSDPYGICIIKGNRKTGIGSDDYATLCTGTDVIGGYKSLGQHKYINGLSTVYFWELKGASLVNTRIDPSNHDVSRGIRIVFNQETFKLHITNLDHYIEILPDEYVSAKDYKLDGVKDGNGNLICNQILVIDRVFSGGIVENGIFVRYRTNKAQRPIPRGKYDILDNKGSKEHPNWFRLDRQDSIPNDDSVNIPYLGRGALRLHLGTLSHGCVTIDGTQEDAEHIWNIVSSIILNSTNTIKVSDRKGTQLFNSQSLRTKYGILEVIGKDRIPFKN